MKPVYVVQVTFKGLAAEMNAEAQEKFGGNSYRTNGMHQVIHTKPAAEKRLRDWAFMGDVAMKEYRRAQSVEEVLFGVLGVA